MEIKRKTIYSSLGAQIDLISWTTHLNKGLTLNFLSDYRISRLESSGYIKW